jgi:hypothetical protein
MTEFPASHRDLLGAQFATFGTVDDHGRPQLSEVWFLHDDGELRVSLNDSRAKFRNLGARPRCSPDAASKSRTRLRSIRNGSRSPGRTRAAASKRATNASVRPPSSSLPSAIRPGKTVMAGLPTKPATKRLAGRS